MDKKEYNKEYVKKWRLDNPEKVKEYKKKWRLDNPEKDKEYRKKWRLENTEKAKEYKKKWRLDNPEKVKKYITDAVTDYSSGKLYKIVCKVTKNIYIGSTKEKNLSRRLYSHTRNYKDFLLGKSSKCQSFDIIEKGDFEIILIELYPCKTKYELETRERFHIENTKCININVPTRTAKERRASEPEITKEKDRIQSQKKSAGNKVKVLCECGTLLSKSSVSKHKKRAIHLDNLKK